MRGTRGKIKNVVYHICVCTIGIIMIYPLLWMLSSSLKPSNTIYQTLTQLVPNNPTIENYIHGWAGFSHTNFGIFIKNTLFVAVIATVGTILSCMMVAYALSRTRFGLKKPLFALVILTMMLPEQIMMIPQYLWYNELKWINTYLPLIVPHFFAVSGFFTYVFMNFMNGIPKDLDEAAYLDGCSKINIFPRIIVPLTKPAIATVAIMSFINRWNDYMSPLLYIKRTPNYTISIALKLYLDSTSSSDYGAMFAMAVVSLIPLFILFVSMNKYLVDGVATSGIKG